MEEVFIYQIKCNITGKAYIGSTINIKKRWQDHFSNLKRNTHVNKYLQSAYNKYGESTFSKIIIMKFDSKYRNKIEEWFINKSNFNSEFNLMNVDSKDYSIKHIYKKLSKESVYKIFDLVNEGKSLKQITLMIGASRTCIRNVISNDYYSDILMPKETEEKYHLNTSKARSERQIEKLNPIFAYKLNGEFVGEYKSIPDAATILNLNRNAVANSLNRSIRIKDFIFYKTKHCFKQYAPKRSGKVTNVYVFDKEFNFLEVSDSKLDLENKYSISCNTINSSCNRLSLCSNLYYFIREKDLDIFNNKYKDKIAMRLFDHELKG